MFRLVSGSRVRHTQHDSHVLLKNLRVCDQTRFGCHRTYTLHFGILPARFCEDRGLLDDLFDARTTGMSDGNRLYVTRTVFHHHVLCFNFIRLGHPDGVSLLVDFQHWLQNSLLWDFTPTSGVLVYGSITDTNPGLSCHTWAKSASIVTVLKPGSMRSPHVFLVPSRAHRSSRKHLGTVF